MKISGNLWLVVSVMAFITISGCNKSQKASPDIKGAEQMKFNITDLDSFTVMGTSTRLTTAEETGEKYTEIWKNFELYNDRLKSISTDQKYYGVSFAANQKDVFDYLAGMAVRNDAVPPDKNLVIRNVPAARYAVFQCPVQDIGRTYPYVLNQWLPKSRYEINKNACSFEQYPPQGHEDSPVFIHIPVRKK